MVAGPLMLLLAACVSGPTITTRSSPDADFSSFGTYDFMQPLSTDGPSGVRTPLSTMLIDSMSREMASRGFTQSDTPDLLVNFFVNTERRLDVQEVPTSLTFHAYRHGRYSAWDTYRTTVREYTLGTLNIDLVDATNSVLAWEGVAQGRLREDVSEIAQEQVDRVVSQVMAEFIHSADYIRQQ